MLYTYQIIFGNQLIFYQLINSDLIILASDGCKEEYPKVIKQLREDFEAPNTQSGEQTFSWFSKFNKVKQKDNSLLLRLVDSQYFLLADFE